MTFAGKKLADTVDKAIKKLVAKDASWSRILAKDLHRDRENFLKDEAYKEKYPNGILRS